MRLDRVWLLFALIGVLFGAAGWPQPTLAEEPPTEPGRRCGGTLRAGEESDACCLIGHVLLGGDSVRANVTIVRGDASMRARTFYEEGGNWYYTGVLSRRPLQAQPGDTITIVAQYQGYRAVVEHVVVSGVQEIDIALDGNAP